MRGVMCLVAVLGLGAGALFCGTSLQELVLASTRAAVLEKEILALSEGVRTLEQAAPEVRAWEALLTQSGPLRPEAIRAYPIQVNRQVRWEEAAALLLIVSNSHPRPGGYRFQPEQFRVERVGSDEDNSTETYALSLQGQFLSIERVP